MFPVLCFQFWSNFGFNYVYLSFPISLFFIAILIWPTCGNAPFIISLRTFLDRYCLFCAREFYPPSHVSPMRCFIFNKLPAFYLITVSDKLERFGWPEKWHSRCSSDFSRLRLCSFYFYHWRFRKQIGQRVRIVGLMGCLTMLIGVFRWCSYFISYLRLRLGSHLREAWSIILAEHSRNLSSGILRR